MLISVQIIMINFDVVDFSERRSEELARFFWRSVWVRPHLILCESTRRPREGKVCSSCMLGMIYKDTITEYIDTIQFIIAENVCIWRVILQWEKKQAWYRYIGALVEGARRQLDIKAYLYPKHICWYVEEIHVSNLLHQYSEKVTNK